MFDVIAFDADDTLWHNETLFLKTQDEFKQLFSDHQDAEWVEQRLFETEMQNLRYFGYGIKGFTLSMIETAIELKGSGIKGTEIQKIIDFGKEMLRAEVQLLEHVKETVAELSQSHELMVITKGDLFDQESKTARSGLAGYFSTVEIVSEKTRSTYEAILAKYGIAPQHFLMVGNSLRSDISPVVAMGGQAVYIPYQNTWAHETMVKPGQEQQGYFELEHMGLLPALIERLSRS
jgi:putative hydrolase of the HAD superfamily